MKRIAVLVIVLLLDGCRVGPDYVKPEFPVASSFQELPQTPGEAPYSVPIATPADLSQWWMQFGDHELQSLIARALQSNLDLLSAASRIREARQQEVIAGAAEYPQLNANAASLRFHSNSNLLGKLGAGAPAGGTSSGVAPASDTTNLRFYSLGFDASWEIDVFGGVRRGVEAARASTEAAVWQLHDGQVSLTAEVASDYLLLRAAQQRIAILHVELQSQQGVLDLAMARRHAGFVTQLDVNQQTAVVASTAAQIPEMQAQVRAMEHAIAVLLAEQPEAITTELDEPAALPLLPPQLPVGLPSDLLRRRPDVRAAERQLAAATAQIGVAVADLYPKFNLLALASFSGTAWKDLLSSKNLGEIGLGQITQPIFNGGKNRANVQAMKEEEQQAYFAYQKAVLGAVKDSEDALARYTSEQEKTSELQLSLASAVSSSSLAKSQYRAGTVTYADVYNAQTTESSTRDQLVQAQATTATDLVSLYKALGGGWRRGKDDGTSVDDAAY